MKIVNKLFGFMALAAMIGTTCMPLVSCMQPVGSEVEHQQPVAKERVNVYAMNIRDYCEEKDAELGGVKWDWLMAVDNEERSSMLLAVDDTGKIPTRLYYKPDKDLDISMNFICRENGLPEIMEFNGYLLYFDNFSGYTFDLAIVAPDETVEYHWGIEYDINFDTWDARFALDGAARSVYNGRSVLDAFTGGLSEDPVAIAMDLVGLLLDIGTCIGAAFIPSLIPGCIIGIISNVAETALWVMNKVANETEFMGEMGGLIINGLNLLLDAMGCLEVAVSVGVKIWDLQQWLDCISAFVTLGSVIWGTVEHLVDYFSGGTKAAVKEEMKPVMGQAKINFYANGGSGTVPAARTIDTVNGYGAVTLPAVTGFSKTGYYTVGWHTAPKTSPESIPVGGERMVSGNTSFYVNWLSEVPNSPTGVTAVPVSSSSIRVSWNKFSGAGYYNVYRSTSASGTYEKVGGNISGTSYTDKGLSLNTMYYYKVSAWSPGAKGDSDKSAYASAKILPDVPIGVTATAISTSNIRVNWDVFSGATLYYVYRSTSASGTYAKLPGNVAAPLTAYTDSGLAANTTYYYKVSAWRPGANGETAQSAAASARTQSDGTAPVITTSSLPNGAVGTAYSYTLTASGDTPITWSIESGALPAGLNHNAGVIAGTPQTPGESHFTVKAVNAAGSGTKALTITITSGGTGPTEMTWHAVTDSTFGSLFRTISIAYGNGTWIVGGTKTNSYMSMGKIAYSTDNGVTWTETDAHFQYGDIVTIAYGNGRFFAGSKWNQTASTIMTRSDDSGVIWTSANANFNDYSRIDGIAFGNGTWVAFTDNKILRSTDNGETWTVVADNTLTSYQMPAIPRKIFSIAYANNRFVAVGNASKMAYSDDNGETWTAVADSTFDTSVTIYAIAYANNRFVAVGSSGRMAYSSDGVNWTAVADSTFGTSSIRRIAYSNNRFVAVGDSGKMAYCDW